MQTVELKQAKEPFRFFTRLHLTELTGLKAMNIEELLVHLKDVPGSSIYHHTHKFLQQHQYLSPEPPNDFAFWVAEALNEDELGESLASIDIVQFPTIRSLREKIIATIEEYIRLNPSAKQRVAPQGEEFHFMKSVSFVFPTPYEVYTLKEFTEVLDKITVDSLYYHIFEARLRHEKKTNDFSYWIETALNDKELAAKIARLDPYTYTLGDLRKTLIKIIKKRIS